MKELDSNMLELFVQRQRTLSSVSLLLSEIENLRGRSQAVLDMISPYIYSDSVHIYRIFDDELYYVVSSWYGSESLRSECLEHMAPFPVSDLSSDSVEQLVSGKSVANINPEEIPLLKQKFVRSSLVYGLNALGGLQGILVFTTRRDDGWDSFSREWFSTVASMLVGSIRRTISNEFLSRELAWKDKVYPIIAHDLRSGVGTIKMLAESALMINNFEEQQEMVEMIKRGANETFMLLDNLLKWSRNKTTGSTVHPELADIVVVIRNVAMDFELFAQTKGVVLQLDCEVQSWMVVVDVEMIRTVVRNLISNSLKFTPAGGVVQVGCDNHMVWVEDTGVGMSTQTIETLRLGDKHITTYGTAGEKGSGLGFSLVRSFLRLHNSQLTITSELGKGSRFSFTL